MKIGAALVLLAVGAILRFAIATASHGVDLRAVGNILMVVGAIGLLIWLIVWAPWGARGRGSSYPPPRTPLEEDEEERLAARQARDPYRRY